MRVRQRPADGLLSVDQSLAGDREILSERSRIEPGLVTQVLSDGARIAALRDLGLLEAGTEEDLDRYTRLATRLLGVPVSLVSLVDVDRQIFKGNTGLAGEFGQAGQTPLSHSFCQYAVAAREPFIVSDAREHPLVADNLAVRDLGVIAYAGIPLVLSDGQSLGAFCAIDSVARVWSEQDIETLGDLAGAVIAHLELRRALAEQGLHDRLTGLVSRAVLCAQSDQLLAAAGDAAAGSIGAICIGLDRFGLINEAYGAAAGDQALKQVAERLAGQVRAGDLLGRVAGDVFVVVGGDMGDEAAAITLAGRLRDAISAAPFDVDDHSIGITATVGLATGTAGKRGADLLSQADDTMRRGKARGGAVRVAGNASGERAAAALRMRAALSGALRREEIQIAYQPIVALDTGSPVGFEALARWTSPQLGAVSPGDFIPIAERTGDIIAIGESILYRACKQAAQWRRDTPELSISVNVAALQLEAANFHQVVQNTLAEHHLPGGALILEITERALITAGSIQTRNLQQLRDLGVRISLDDFGTGYSALGYLKRFPIDELKIDRSFVEELKANRQSTAIVQAILALAQGLELAVVAEGIETPGQHQLLKLLGCHLGQGDLFAQARSANEISLRLAGP